MPEPILIVDETPTNRKLAQRVLAGAGYDARTAENAESALALLPDFQPLLVLTDLRLSGMDGLALARRIKQDPLTRQTVVIALTGRNAEHDVKRALEAGCDDYIVKPIDTRTFPSAIEAHLARREREAGAGNDAAQFTPADLPAWASGICRDFLREGSTTTRAMLSLGDSAQTADLRRSAHLWSGLAATLGYPEITVLARRLEDLLRRPDVARSAEVRQVVERLAAAFSELPAPDSPAAAPSDLPYWLVEQLSGKRVVAAGFDSREFSRVAGVFSMARVQPMKSASDTGECDLVIATAAAAEPLLEGMHNGPQRPVLLVGTAPASVQAEALLNPGGIDFAALPWTGEELLARACRLLTRQPERETAPPASGGADSGRAASVVIADDDPTTLTLLGATVRNYGMECRVAEDGGQALELIRAAPPDVAILDVIMPNLDGFEVLAAIRNDRNLKHIRVMLLTALQQETDVVRGFAIGADDYIIKPFSPVEVIARLRRLARSGA
ncbi:MAG TPA: response regulator [Bryobacteraceae bacterium]